ncbi:hypothetical protein [Streptomyces decoyicus]
MSADAVRLGRCVTVVGLPALAALTAGWLFLGARPARTAVVWAALAALAGCVLAITGCVLRAGRQQPPRLVHRRLRRPAAVGPRRQDRTRDLPHQDQQGRRRSG